MAFTVSCIPEKPAFEIEYPKGIFWGNIDAETKVTVVVFATIGFLSGGIFTALALAGGGTAAGRRVQLPWGGGEFNFNSVINNGRYLMKRSIEWAAGQD